MKKPDEGRSRPRDAAERLHRDRVEVRHDEAEQEKVQRQEPGKGGERRRRVGDDRERRIGGRDQDEADQGAVRQAPHPDPLNQAAVHDRGDRQRQRDRAEHDREQAVEAVDALEDLLRRVDVAHHAAEDAADRDRVADRLPGGDDLPERARDPAQGERRTLGLRPRLRQPQRHQHHDQDRGDEEEHEDPAPMAEEEEDLAGGRRQHRHDDEHHHDEGHDLRHVAAGKKVAHHCNRDHARCCTGDALQRPRPEEGRILGGDKGHHGRGRIDAEADEDHGLPAEAIRQRSVEELAGGESQHVVGDDELALVLGRETEIPGDRRQCREHDVDRKRRQRHHHGNDGDEFEPDRRRSGARFFDRERCHFRRLTRTVPDRSARSYRQAGGVDFTEQRTVRCNRSSCVS